VFHPRRTSRTSADRVNAAAAARLEAARSGLAELSQRVSVPTENLVTPEVVRGLCWDWQPVDDVAVDDFLREAQVRPWQRELVVPALVAALESTTDDI
jgi:ribonuclease D